MSARLACVGFLVLRATPSLAFGPNACTTLPLHAVEGTPLSCSIGGDPCASGTINTTVTSGTWTIYVLVRNHETVTGLQTAFEWDPSWQLLAFAGSCQTNQTTSATPQSPGGAQDGTFTTTFDAVTGPSTAVAGYLVMHIQGPGALEQVQSASPGGTYVAGTGGERDTIRPDINAGRVQNDGSPSRDGCFYPFVTIEDPSCCLNGDCVALATQECVAAGGVSLDPGENCIQPPCAGGTDCSTLHPVEQTSWGKVKALYR